jgi:tRNA (cytidine56-2'-O)-methyltransferase
MITILRLGHRPARDKRITTHVGLVARAFNAEQMLVDIKDIKLEKTLEGVNARFGGKFKVQTDVDWRAIIRNWDGIIVHLTMYGEHLDDVIKNIPKEKNTKLLVIVGSEKVPREIYEKADFNIAIGHQPHSEVAALAIFLDRYFGGKELRKSFDGRLVIKDSRKGKLVIDTKKH